MARLRVSVTTSLSNTNPGHSPWDPLFQFLPLTKTNLLERLIKPQSFCFLEFFANALSATAIVTVHTKKP